MSDTSRFVIFKRMSQTLFAPFQNSLKTPQLSSLRSRLNQEGGCLRFCAMFSVLGDKFHYRTNKTSPRTFCGVLGNEFPKNIDLWSR